MQNRQKYEEFLAKVKVLADLDTYERNKLCDCLKVQNFGPNEYVIREGERGDTFYMVMKGEGQALKKNEASGEEEVVYEYKANMYFGELSLLRDEPRAASIKTTTDMRVASIDRKAFKRILGPLEDILKRNTAMYDEFVKK